MPALKIGRNELFAQGLAKGMNQSEAARHAGYSASRASATGSQLAKKPEIIARVADLNARVMQHVASTVAVTRDWVIAGLIQTIEDARAKEQYGVVRQCFVDIGKNLGMFVEKTELKVTWERLLSTDISQLTGEELELLTQYNLKIAYGDDAERIRQERERQLRDSGLLIEASADTPYSAPPRTEATAVESAPVVEKSENCAPPSWADLSESERKLLAAEWSTRGTALPEGLPKEDRLAWLDLNWPLGPQNEPEMSGT